MNATLCATDMVREFFQDSLSELIACYTEDAPQFGESLECDADFTSIIGLSSPELSTSIALMMSTDTANALAACDLLDPEDWLGELANQLAGRLKNKLHRCGLTPSLSTPVTVGGQYLSVSSTAKTVIEVGVTFGSHVALTQLTLTCEDRLELTEQGNDLVAEEGSLDLF